MVERKSYLKKSLGVRILSFPVTRVDGKLKPNPGRTNNGIDSLEMKGQIIPLAETPLLTRTCWRKKGNGMDSRVLKIVIKEIIINLVILWLMGI